MSKRRRPRSPSPTSPSSHFSDDEIRCICTFTDDDGSTIACDRCGKWQHMACVGVDERHVPEEWFCERCVPREVDRKRAMEVQMMRRRRGGATARVVDDGETTAAAAAWSGRRGTAEGPRNGGESPRKRGKRPSVGGTLNTISGTGYRRERDKEKERDRSDRAKDPLSPLPTSSSLHNDYFPTNGAPLLRPRGRGNDAEIMWGVLRNYEKSLRNKKLKEREREKERRRKANDDDSETESEDGWWDAATTTTDGQIPTHLDPDSDALTATDAHHYHMRMYHSSMHYIPLSFSLYSSMVTSHLRKVLVAFHSQRGTKGMLPPQSRRDPGLLVPIDAHFLDTFVDSTVAQRVKGGWACFVTRDVEGWIGSIGGVYHYFSSDSQLKNDAVVTNDGVSQRGEVGGVKGDWNRERLRDRVVPPFVVPHMARCLALRASTAPLVVDTRVYATSPCRYVRFTCCAERANAVLRSCVVVDKKSGKEEGGEGAEGAEGGRGRLINEMVYLGVFTTKRVMRGQEVVVLMEGWKASGCVCVCECCRNIKSVGRRVSDTDNLNEEDGSAMDVDDDRAGEDVEPRDREGQSDAESESQPVKQELSENESGESDEDQIEMEGVVPVPLSISLPGASDTTSLHIPPRPRLNMDPRTHIGTPTNVNTETDSTNSVPTTPMTPTPTATTVRKVSLAEFMKKRAQQREKEKEKGKSLNDVTEEKEQDKSEEATGNHEVDGAEDQDVKREKNESPLIERKERETDDTGGPTRRRHRGFDVPTTTTANTTPATTTTTTATTSATMSPSPHAYTPTDPRSRAPSISVSDNYLRSPVPSKPIIGHSPHPNHSSGHHKPHHHPSSFADRGDRDRDIRDRPDLRGRRPFSPPPLKAYLDEIRRRNQGGQNNAPPPLYPTNGTPALPVAGGGGGQGYQSGRRRSYFDGGYDHQHQHQQHHQHHPSMGLTRPTSASSRRMSEISNQPSNTGSGSIRPQNDATTQAVVMGTGRSRRTSSCSSMDVKGYYEGGDQGGHVGSASALSAGRVRSREGGMYQHPLTTPTQQQPPSGQTQQQMSQERGPQRTAFVGWKRRRGVSPVPQLPGAGSKSEPLSDAHTPTISTTNGGARHVDALNEAENTSGQMVKREHEGMGVSDRPPPRPETDDNGQDDDDHVSPWTRQYPYRTGPGLIVGYSTDVVVVVMVGRTTLTDDEDPPPVEVAVGVGTPEEDGAESEKFPPPYPDIARRVRIMGRAGVGTHNRLLVVGRIAKQWIDVEAPFPATDMWDGTTISISRVIPRRNIDSIIHNTGITRTSSMGIRGITMALDMDKRMDMGRDMDRDMDRVKGKGRGITITIGRDVMWVVGTSTIDGSLWVINVIV
ncbi:myeloid lymphoid or mixed-lineage leukemia 5 (trithorax, ) [Gaertneriomyces sp. JEL0708]|nr:myeloid lymphoid or mixed-lineage leukemia 5 (trithorax, ) [Gaertneriomyces sp. JEL0708]